MEDRPLAGDWPIESGHKDAVRWLALRNRGGRGLVIGSATPFTATASPFSTFQLSEALHPTNLAPDSAYTLHVDHVLSTSAGAPPSDAAPVTTMLRMRSVGPEDTSPGDFLGVGPPSENGRC